jgi:hypothetical protein
MRRAVRFVIVVAGITMWGLGVVLITDGSHVGGAILVLLGCVTALLALTSDRASSVIDVVTTWLSNLP